MLLYTLTKKFIEVQGKMLNAFSIILFYKVMWWFDGKNIDQCGTNETKVQSPFLTYVMWNMYIYIYTLYICVMYNI
jgi:hypothetical protein